MVTVHGPDNAPTIVADQNSSVFIDPGSTISTSGASTAGPAIVALQSSSANLVGATVNGPTGNHTIVAAQGSSVLVQGSTITADVPFSVNNALAVLTAAQSSSLVLAGGNTITNNAAGGAAVLVSGGSTFLENNGTPFGFTAAVDTINGGGRINTQSVIELGASGGGGGVDWTGNVAVSQFSTFRADGNNVMINGTLTLDQAANGYFNHTKGSIIDITLVRCNSTTDHVANPTFVTPPVTIGPPPGCALF